MQTSLMSLRQHVNRSHSSLMRSVQGARKLALPCSRLCYMAPPWSQDQYCKDWQHGVLVKSYFFMPRRMRWGCLETYPMCCWFRGDLHQSSRLLMLCMPAVIMPLLNAYSLLGSVAPHQCCCNLSVTCLAASAYCIPWCYGHGLRHVSWHAKARRVQQL